MKYAHEKLIILLSLLVFNCQCNNPSSAHQLRPFYYPYKDMQAGMIYEYIPLNNKKKSHVYWYLQSIKEGEKWYMQELYLEDDYLPLQFVREKIVSNGVLIKKIDLFLPDNSQQLIEVSGKIHSGNVFSFDAKKYERVLLSKYVFEIPDGSQSTTTIIKNRQFEGDTTINIAGHKYQTARFRVKELVSMGNEKDGYTEPEFSGVEHYGKNTGLIHYKKEAEGKTIFEYALKKRYPLNEATDQLQEAIQSFLSKKDK